MIPDGMDFLKEAPVRFTKRRGECEGIPDACWLVYCWIGFQKFIYILFGCLELGYRALE